MFRERLRACNPQATAWQRVLANSPDRATKSGASVRLQLHFNDQRHGGSDHFHDSGLHTPG